MATASPRIGTGLKFATAFWLCIVLACLIYGGWWISQGGAFSSNILAVLPSEFQQQLGTAATPNGSDQPSTQQRPQQPLNQRFIILVSGSESAAVSLQQRLQSAGFAPSTSAAESKRQYLTFYKPYRHQLLSGPSRERLQQLSSAELAAAALRDLTSPLPPYRAYSLAEDPFNLGSQWLTAATASTRQFHGGKLPSLTVEQRRWWLLSATLNDNPFATAAQQRLATVIEQFHAQHPEVKLLRSGLVFHATEAANLARAEISTVGVGSLLAILMLGIWVFRSASSLAFIALVLITSSTVAAAFCLLLFGQIHLITLAFGSTLLGLAVDYCFHFLVKQQQLGNGYAAALLIRRGLIISLVSSLCAYGLQATSPLPLLQQFAAFMAAGLAAACIAVLLFGTAVRRPTQAGWESRFAVYPQRVAPLYLRLASRPKLATAALVGLLVAAMAQAATSSSRDDIRLLNSSSPELLASERQVQTLLALPDSQRFIEISAEDSEQLLSTVAQVQELLDQHSLPAQSILQQLPSQEQQLADHRLIQQKLYANGAALEQLCTLLGSDCSPWNALDTQFQSGLNSEQLLHSQLPLPPLLLSHSAPQASTPAGLIARLLLLPDNATQLSQNAALIDELQALSNVRYRDKVAELSLALKQHRLQVSYLLLAFLGLFALLCFLLYRQRCWPAVAALVLALACGLASAGNGISLFHILALLLIMGLAIDTAIFYLELGLNAATWLASSLALATSTLAFGLLALSDMPLLQHFGQTVCAGLLATWLLTPLLFLLSNQMASSATLYSSSFSSNSYASAKEQHP